MRRGEGECLVCRKRLAYLEHDKPVQCRFCGKTAMSNVTCEDGHYVCDACHAKQGIEAVMRCCAQTGSKNPIAIMQAVMEDPYIHMHGPEHHTLVGAALIAAYINSGGAADRNAALGEMRARGAKYPGGACGYWGACGAAVSAGMFWSIVTGATPLSGKSWSEANLLTSRCLEGISKLGGPRCCKRNAFTAARIAAGCAEEFAGVKMELPEKIECAYSSENRQCRGKNCPYYVQG